jgi:hypothetical protein
VRGRSFAGRCGRDAVTCPRQWALLSSSWLVHSAVVATGAVVLAAIAFGVAGRSADHHRCAPPDWPLWRQGIDTSTSPTNRQRIADEIVSCHLLRGRSKQDVRLRLGPPQESSSDHDEWLWLTGTSRGISIDNEELVVDFSDGRVRRASVTVGG